jgi:Phasin protein
MDYYFDHLKKSVASVPSGGTEFGEKVKAYAEKNIAATQEFVRDLSYAKDIQDMVQIQMEFMHAQLEARHLPAEYHQLDQDFRRAVCGGHRERALVQERGNVVGGFADCAGPACADTEACLARSTDRRDSPRDQKPSQFRQQFFRGLCRTNRRIARNSRQGEGRP